jgi:hypothetical protein
VVADMEAAATLVEATLVALNLAEVTSAGLTLAVGGPISTLAGPTFTSPGATASGIVAVGLAGMVDTTEVMADFMVPATRMAEFIRTVTGRHELCPAATILNPSLVARKQP